MSTPSSVDADARLRVEFETDTNFMIEAGAGTGKTTLMVARAVAMIRSGAATIDELVIITFTDAAAAEISSRTRQAFEVLLSGTLDEISVERLTPLDAAELPRVQAALDGIHRAHIQTIHSFAGSMLRERPVEAGLDPGFETLEEMQASVDFDDAYSAWLDATLSDPPPELVLAFDCGFNVKHLRGLAETMHRHRSVLPLATMKPESELNVIAFVDDVVSGARDLRPLMAYAAKDPHTPDEVSRICAFAEGLRGFADRGDHGGLVQCIARSAPGISHGKGLKGDWTDAEAWREAKAIRKRIRDGIELIQKALGNSLMIDIMLVVERFVISYEAERKAGGRATFDDLLNWARDLLRAPLALAYFRAQYKRLIVDEFQDTDPVQADLVCCLAGEGDPPDARSWTTMAPRDGVLTVVGDPKQSIYRFRRADLSVFDGIRKGVMGPFQETIVQNYRSSDAILQWVNAVFDDAFVEASGVQPANTQLVPQARAVSLGNPSVHVAWAGPHSRVVDARADEAVLLGQMLVHAYDSGWKVYDPRAKSLRPITWGDMVVLVPAWTQFDPFREALRAMGIPFRVGGGSGFFGRPEVSDLCSLLDAIDDPLNAVAIVAALRSPMFACSDDDLVLATAGGQRIGYLKSPGKDSPPLVAEGLKTMRLLNKELPGLSLADAVRIAVDRSLLVEGALARDGDEQCAANVLKVVDLAKRFADTRRVGTGIRDFTRWMREQRELDDDVTRSGLREGDAGVADAGDDAVSVMTIHASKGLEFPLVALGNMSGDRSSTITAVPDRAKGHLHVRFSGPQDVVFSTTGYDAAETAESTANAAETTRLVYVAATRARDYILIPLAKEKAGDYAAPLRRHLPDHGAEHAGTVTDLGVHVFDPSVLAGVAPLDGQERVDADESAIDEVEAVQTSWRAGRAAALATAARGVQVNAASMHDTSASGPDDEPNREDDLIEEQADRSLSEGEGERFVQDSPEPGSDTEAIRKGNALHLVMERADYAALGDLNDLVTHACSVEGAEGHEGEILAWAVSCLGTATVSRAIAADELFRELPFKVKVGDHFETGRIDLLIREGETLTVVDWKSHKVERGEEQDHAQRTFAGQANAYVRGLRLSVPELPVKEVIFVYARTGGAAKIELDDEMLFEEA